MNLFILSCFVAGLRGISGSADLDSGLNSTLEYHKYIVVGAGPGGIQMAHWLESARRDYVVLEQHPMAGSFFVKYPRWKQLISINKPWTGRSDSFDFNSRHDWNSLLSEESHTRDNSQVEVICPGVTDDKGFKLKLSVLANVTCYASDTSSTDERKDMNSVDKRLLFKHYTTSYYPEAPVLAEYLSSWANGTLPRGPPLQISFNTRVMQVERPPGYISKGAPTNASPRQVSASGETDPWPRLAEIAHNTPRFHVTVNTANVTRTYACTYLIWAGGLQEVVKPHGINTDEAILKGWVQRYDTASTDVSQYVNKSVLLLGRGNAAFEFANHVLGVASYVHLVGQRRKRLAQSVETHYPGDVRHIHSTILESYLLKSMDGVAEVFLQTLSFEREDGVNKTWVRDTRSACTTDVYGRKTSRCLFRRAYDHVIVCPGWRMARGLDQFSSSTQPELYSNGKHPAITPRYESVNVPGLFFAGNLGHAMDFKKSSGGFIHGFRYTARALHRELEEEEQAAYAAAAAIGSATVTATAPPSLLPPSSRVTSAGKRVSIGSGWPRRLHSGLRAATEAFMRRINHAAGPYQMFGGLGDVLVLPPFPADQAAGFIGPGTLAPFSEPWTFPPRNGSYPDSGYVSWKPRPSREQLSSPSRKRSDDVLDAAMTGWLLEELPTRLVEHKVSGWAAQLAHTLGLDARMQYGLNTHLAAMPVLGSEYIVLTLEFGTGSGPLPGDLSAKETASMEKQAKAMQSGSSDVAVTESLIKGVRARSELQRDPYSLLRANVGMHNPEASHFLHPVLRYFHTGMGPLTTPNEWVLGVPTLSPLYPGGPLPVAECHLVEDFWTDWSAHAQHVLAVARFLQEVAARRAASALAVQVALAPADMASASATGPATPAGPGAILATSGGALPPSGQDISRSHQFMVHGVLALRHAWEAPRPRHKHADVIDQVAGHDGTRLFFKGKAADGGQGWFHHLSVQAADELFATGPRAFLVHLVDADPRPLSPAEIAWTADVQADSVHKASIGVMSFFEEPLASETSPAGPMSKAEEAEQARLLAKIELQWRKFSASQPGLPILTAPCRSGADRVWANSMLREGPLQPADRCGTGILLLFKDGFKVPFPADKLSPFDDPKSLAEKIKSYA